MEFTKFLDKQRTQQNRSEYISWMWHQPTDEIKIVRLDEFHFHDLSEEHEASTIEVNNILSASREQEDESDENIAQKFLTSSLMKKERQKNKTEKLSILFTKAQKRIWWMFFLFFRFWL